MLGREAEDIDRQLVILAQAEVRDSRPGEAVHCEAVPGQGGASVPATRQGITGVLNNIVDLPVEEGGGGGEPQHLVSGGLRDLVPVRVDKPGPELGRGEMLAQVEVSQSHIFIVE